MVHQNLTTKRRDPKIPVAPKRSTVSETTGVSTPSAPAWIDRSPLPVDMQRALDLPLAGLGAFGFAPKLLATPKAGPANSPMNGAAPVDWGTKLADLATTIDFKPFGRKHPDAWTPGKALNAEGIGALVDPSLSTADVLAKGVNPVAGDGATFYDGTGPDGNPVSVYVGPKQELYLDFDSTGSLTGYHVQDDAGMYQRDFTTGEIRIFAESVGSADLEARLGDVPLAAEFLSNGGAFELHEVRGAGSTDSALLAVDEAGRQLFVRTAGDELRVTVKDAEGNLQKVAAIGSKEVDGTTVDWALEYDHLTKTGSVSQIDTTITNGGGAASLVRTRFDDRIRGPEAGPGVKTETRVERRHALRDGAPAGRQELIETTTTTGKLDQGEFAHVYRREVVGDEQVQATFTATHVDSEGRPTFDARTRFDRNNELADMELSFGEERLVGSMRDWTSAQNEALAGETFGYGAGYVFSGTDHAMSTLLGGEDDSVFFTRGFKWSADRADDLTRVDRWTNGDGATVSRIDASTKFEESLTRHRSTSWIVETNTEAGTAIQTFTEGSDDTRLWTERTDGRWTTNTDMTRVGDASNTRTSKGTVQGTVAELEALLGAERIAQLGERWTDFVAGAGDAPVAIQTETYGELTTTSAVNVDGAVIAAGDGPGDSYAYTRANDGTEHLDVRGDRGTFVAARSADGTLEIPLGAGSAEAEALRAAARGKTSLLDTWSDRVAGDDADPTIKQMVQGLLTSPRVKSLTDDVRMLNGIRKILLSHAPKLALAAPEAAGHAVGVARLVLTKLSRPGSVMAKPAAIAGQLEKALKGQGGLLQKSFTTWNQVGKLGKGLKVLGGLASAWSIGSGIHEIAKGNELKGGLMIGEGVGGAMSTFGGATLGPIGLFVTAGFTVASAINDNVEGHAVADVLIPDDLRD